MSNAELQIQNTGSVLFVNKSRLKTILTMSIPIMVASLGMNLFGPIDTAMVGRLGDVALAATGVGSALFFFLFTLAMGLGVGVQTLVARRVGEGKIHIAGHDLNAGIVIGGVLGLGLMILGYLILPVVYSLMNQDPSVVQQGVAYLRARLPQIVFMCVVMSFTSYWNGTRLSKLLPLTITISLVSNVIFNYLLIFGNFGFPRLGVTGAGLASTLATFCGLLAHFILGMMYARKNGFLHGLPDRERIGTMIQVSIPMSVGQFLMMIGSLVIFYIVGLLGTKEVAAINVLMNIVMLAAPISTGVATALTTLVSQALGRKDIKEAKQWGWDAAKIGTVIQSALFGVCFLLFPQAILSVFIVNASTIAIATLPLQMSGLFMPLVLFGSIIISGLVGAGATFFIMVFSLAFQWCLSLPLQWLVGVYFGYGLNGIWFSSLVVYGLICFTISFVWYRERWALVKI